MGRPTAFLVWISIMTTAISATADYPELEVDREALRQRVRDLSTIRPPRNYRNPDALNRAAALIQTWFQAVGLETREQTFTVEGTTYRNVITSVRTDRPERFVVGAHYDVCGDQPGADDNASAVAGLVEIARLVRIHSEGLRYQVDFVAYSLEEPPFFGTRHMGSRYHARSLKQAGVPVRGMISLEMIGYFTDAPDTQRFPLGLMRFFYPTAGNFIAVVGNLRSRGLVQEVKGHMRRASIGVESLASPAWVPGVGLSDQSSFWKQGYPAVMITDTAFYRNPHYHLPSDTIDTLDFERMGEVVKGVTWAVLNMK